MSKQLLIDSIKDKIYTNTERKIKGDVIQEVLVDIVEETHPESYEPGLTEIEWSEIKGEAPSVSFFENDADYQSEDEVKHIIEVALEDYQDEDEVKQFVDETIGDLEYVKNVEYSGSTHLITVTFKNNSVLNISIPTLDIIKDIGYDAITKEIVLIKKDNTELRVDVSDLVDIYTGSTGDNIQIIVGNDNKISAVLLNDTVTEAQLTSVLRNKVNANSTPITAVAGGGETANKTLTFGGTFLVLQASQAAGGQMTITPRTMTMPSFTAVAAAGETANKTLTFGGTFVVNNISQSTAGQVTRNTYTMTMPATPTTITGNAGSATRLGTSGTAATATQLVRGDGTQPGTVGGALSPFYLNNGVPTTCRDMVNSISLQETGNNMNPNITLIPVILSNHANTPTPNSAYWYVHTYFYNSISDTSSRFQIAYRYSGGAEVYIRYFYPGPTWTSWERLAKTADITAVAATGETVAKTLTFGGTFIVHRISQAAGGQLTSTAYTMTMPAAPTTITGNAGSATRLGTSGTAATAGQLVLGNGTGYTSNVGSVVQPVYIAAGAPTVCNASADGTGVTNGNLAVRNASGQIYAAGGFFQSSDERLKTITGIVDNENIVNNIAKLRKVYYILNDGNSLESIGVIAQDVQKICPQLVTTDEETGNLSVDYPKLSVLALAAVDNLNDKMTELSNRLEKIEKLLNLAS